MSPTGDGAPGPATALSVLDLFTIGVGPSSSHTVGPMRAARHVGHEDYLTTRRIYGHLMPNAQLEASVAASLSFQATRLSLAGAPPALI